MDNEQRPFSEREGYRSVAHDYDKDPMPKSLRNKLWNKLCSVYLSRIESRDRIDLGNLGFYENCLKNPYDTDFMQRLWHNELNATTDTIPSNWSDCYNAIKEYFYKCEWVSVYEILEFFLREYKFEENGKTFIINCNDVFKDEKAPYRFVGFLITPITSEVEGNEIEMALRSPIETTRIHLQTALKHLSDRSSPVYRSSIEESIKALESTCRMIVNNPSATLSGALKALEEKGLDIHPALFKGFNKLYGYSSDEDGIRHALKKPENLDFEDAKYFLVSCSAFINFLIEKANKAGIDLTKQV